MSKEQQKKENPLINIAVNIIIPTVVLSKLSDEQYLGPQMGLIAALIFPVGYGIWDFAKEKKVNGFSILGFVSILLTGVVGLLELDPFWIAIKEAAVPLVFGIAILISMKTSYPLVKKFIYNDQIMDIDKVDTHLRENNQIENFQKKLDSATVMLAGSFFLSAALNYGLARYLVKSPAGTVAFNEELGQMTALSFPVIAVPSTIVMGIALWYLIKSIKECTGLQLEEVMRTN
ncbi:VC0807 family protein [Sediminitomix flava]|uniref:MFS transporter n=1 Tax=Sediminitomix flava TaxID=379075 RepID=A0A315ZDJ4_SEDFL|nr:VC0807 family protein [Sediminitomix flava]PWJ42938.1 hypothetical protein BC781_102485 [Sediminitomix flava]